VAETALSGGVVTTLPDVRCGTDIDGDIDAGRSHATRGAGACADAACRAIAPTNLLSTASAAHSAHQAEVWRDEFTFETCLAGRRGQRTRRGGVGRVRLPPRIGSDNTSRTIAEFTHLRNAGADALLARTKALSLGSGERPAEIAAATRLAPSFATSTA
jgi:hypothetical protein